LKSGIHGTFALSDKIFDRWEDPELFYADLEECCVILGIRTGLQFAVSSEKAHATISAWKLDRTRWVAHLLPIGTADLSHLKKASLLIEKLCAFTPVTVSGRPAGNEPKVEGNYQDSDPWPDLPNRLSKKDAQKFLDGGCHYVAWLILYHVCEFYERHRTDRIDDFVPRITEEFELDVVSGLLSAKVSAQAMHLILKALFLRD
jgi:hypothetical protein